jgi:hypothetical protein
MDVLVTEEEQQEAQDDKTSSPQPSLIMELSWEMRNFGIA